MDIYETPDGKVVTTGSFSVAEWDEYQKSLPKSKRTAPPTGSVSPEPAPAESGDSADAESKSSAKGGKG